MKLIFIFFKFFNMIKMRFGKLIFVLIYKNKIRVGKLIKYDGGFKFYSNHKDFSVYVGDNLTLRRDCSLMIEGDANLKIGNNVFFNNNSSISCLGKITIGNDCLFGENIKIYDHNHNYRDKSLLIREQGFKIGTVSIGNNVWIGSNVTILKDVIIGDNCVIGANCLIYKDIPANSIVKHEEKLIIMEKK